MNRKTINRFHKLFTAAAVCSIAFLVACSAVKMESAEVVFQKMKLHHAQKLIAALGAIDIPKKFTEEQSLELELRRQDFFPVEARSVLKMDKAVDLSGELPQGEVAMSLLIDGRTYTDQFGTVNPILDDKSASLGEDFSHPASKWSYRSAAVDSVDNPIDSLRTVTTPQQSEPIPFSFLFEMSAALIDDALFARIDSLNILVENMIDLDDEQLTVGQWYGDTIDDMNALINENNESGQDIDIRSLVQNPAVELEKMKGELTALLPKLGMWKVVGYDSVDDGRNYRVLVDMDKEKMMNSTDAIIDYLTATSIYGSQLTSLQMKEAKNATEELKEEARRFIQEELSELKGTVMISKETYAFTGFEGVFKTIDGSVDLEISLKLDGKQSLVRVKDLADEGHFIALERNGERFQIISDSEKFADGTYNGTQFFMTIYDEGSKAVEVVMMIDSLTIDDIRMNGIITPADEDASLVIDAIRFIRNREEGTWSGTIQASVLYQSSPFFKFTYDMLQQKEDNLEFQKPEGYLPFSEGMTFIEELTPLLMQSMQTDMPTSVSPVSESPYFEPGMQQDSYTSEPVDISDPELQEMMKDMSPEEREIMQQFF